MRVVVVGAGAIGAPIAAQLHESGQPTVLVARGANYDAMSNDGVTIVTPNWSRTSRPPVVDGVSSLNIGPDDAVMLCVKSQDTKGVLDELIAISSPVLPVFCAQNGVANERLVRSHFSNTYGVCVMSPASYLEPGRIEIFASPVIGVLDVGRWSTGVDERAIELSRRLSDAGFASNASEDIETMKWGKLLSNVLNAFEVLCGPIKREEGITARVEDEASRCMGAHGVDVVRAKAMIQERTTVINYHSINAVQRVGSSSWQSVLRGTGSIGTDYLNGEIVALGRRYGIPTPANEILQRRANDLVRRGGPPGSVSVAELEAELTSFDS